MDVLIVGSGPAGMLLAAQMSQFPGVTTRIIERSRRTSGARSGRRHPAAQRRDVPGVRLRRAHRRRGVRHRLHELLGPTRRTRATSSAPARTEDDAFRISEFPHLIVNQARVLDYFAEAAAQRPARMTPDYGVEFLGLTCRRRRRVPRRGRLRRARRHRRRRGAHRAREVRRRAPTARAAACARRSAASTSGGQSAHAWGVMDVLVEHRLPRLAHQVRDQSPRRATSCTSRARAAT